ncbi:MAG: amidohydrolase family protein [Pedobacter sp.]|jgi:predicted TIM-barrel fold metal-dependent hydrolase
MNRKRFLAAASVMTITSIRGVSLLQAAVTERARPLLMIDTHQHLVDFERFGKGWSRPPTIGNFGIKEYLDAMSGLNLKKAVYVEVAVPKDRRHEEALYAIELCKANSNPTVGAVIRADLYADDFIEYMSQFKEYPCIKGIRAGFNAAEDILSEKIIKHVRGLGSLNMGLDLALRPEWLEKLPRLVELCPETRFLINHCGGVDPRAFIEPIGKFGMPDHDPDQWIAGMKAMATHKNVACKISGVGTRSSGYPLTAENLGPAINQCLDIFGPDRVMFAADWPWVLKTMEIRTWVDILKTVVANRSYKHQKKLFYDNALKFYNI